MQATKLSLPLTAAGSRDDSATLAQPHNEMRGTDKRPPLVSGDRCKQRLTDKPEDRQ
jgi:hypothetical protein